MAAQAYNPTGSPVIVDDAGHVLGGGEHGTVDTTTARIIAAVGAGALVLTNPATQAKVATAAKDAASGESTTASTTAKTTTTTSSEG